MAFISREELEKRSNLLAEQVTLLVVNFLVDTGMFSHDEMVERLGKAASHFDTDGEVVPDELPETD